MEEYKRPGLARIVSYVRRHPLQTTALAATFSLQACAADSATDAPTKKQQVVKQWDQEAVDSYWKEKITVDHLVGVAPVDTSQPAPRQERKAGPLLRYLKAEASVGDIVQGKKQNLKIKTSGKGAIKYVSHKVLSGNADGISVVQKGNRIYVEADDFDNLGKYELEVVVRQGNQKYKSKVTFKVTDQLEQPGAEDKDDGKPTILEEGDDLDKEWGDLEPAPAKNQAPSIVYHGPNELTGVEGKKTEFPKAMYKDPDSPEATLALKKVSGPGKIKYEKGGMVWRLEADKPGTYKLQITCKDEKGAEAKPIDLEFKVAAAKPAVQIIHKNAPRIEKFPKEAINAMKDQSLDFGLSEDNFGKSPGKTWYDPDSTYDQITVEHTVKFVDGPKAEEGTDFEIGMDNDVSFKTLGEYEVTVQLEDKDGHKSKKHTARVNVTRKKRNVGN